MGEVNNSKSNQFILHYGILLKMEIQEVQPPEEIKNVTPWGNVTDPTEHNPNNFRYLVYGINPAARLTMPGLHTPKDIDKKDGDQTINIADSPERIAERVSLSCSLIDQNHTGTWGNAGIIVESPTTNVIMDGAEDLGAISENKEMLLKQAEGRKLIPPDELLSSSSRTSYNEIVILAENKGQKVKLGGFFVKVTEDGKPLDDHLAMIFKEHATRLNLPLVFISEPNPYFENKIVKNGAELVGVQFDGKLYSLTGNFRFRTTEQEGISTFSSPHEMEEVFEFLAMQGSKEEEINRLREDYRTTDAERQTARASFSKDGRVVGVKKRQGYGRKETILSINDGGYAYKVNAYETSKASIKAFSSLGNSFQKTKFTSSSPTNYLSVDRHETMSMINQALETASPDERVKIEEWYQKVKDYIERN